MSTTREQLLERLRKLAARARAEIDSPEGRTARRKLRELMARYGITEVELGGRGGRRRASEPPQPAPTPRPPARPRRGGRRRASDDALGVPVRLRVGGIEVRFRL